MSFIVDNIVRNDCFIVENSSADINDCFIVDDMVYLLLIMSDIDTTINLSMINKKLINHCKNKNFLYNKLNYNNLPIIDTSYHWIKNYQLIVSANKMAKEILRLNEHDKSKDFDVYQTNGKITIDFKRKKDTFVDLKIFNQDNTDKIMLYNISDIINISESITIKLLDDNIYI